MDMDEGEISLANAIGRAVGNSTATAGHLFGATAHLMLKAGICTQGDIAEALEHQAAVASPEAAESLRAFAKPWFDGGRPRLTVVD